MVKILAMSDLHGHLPPDVPDCDILIVAGDNAPDYEVSGRFDTTGRLQKTWYERQFTQWLNFQRKSKEVIWIGGNHDFALDNYPDLGPSVAKATNTHYLQDSGCEIDGITFWGIPWVPHLAYWAFHANDSAMRNIVDAIPKNTQVLISHGPPYGYADECGRKWGRVEHVGSMLLNGKLMSVMPRAVVCGHIHEGAGVYRHENTITDIWNVAIKDDSYKVVRGATDISSSLEY